MAKVKKMVFLTGASLLEVIVSTVIILIAFLLFSILIGQLMTARKMTPEIQILFGISGTGWISDTNMIRQIYRNNRIEMKTELADTFLFMHVQVVDTQNNRKLFQYYFEPKSEKQSLYQ